MALVVAPAALSHWPCLLEFGTVGFWFVDLGLTWIQFIAGYLAEFDLAVRMIKTRWTGYYPCFHLACCGVFCGAGNTGNNGILVSLGLAT